MRASVGRPKKVQLVAFGLRLSLTKDVADIRSATGDGIDLAGPVRRLCGQAAIWGDLFGRDGKRYRMARPASSAVAGNHQLRIPHRLAGSRVARV